MHEYLQIHCNFSASLKQEAHLKSYAFDIYRPAYYWYFLDLKICNDIITKGLMPERHVAVWLRDDQMSMMQASLIKDSLLAGLICWETNCIRMKVWGCLIAAGILLFFEAMRWVYALQNLWHTAWDFECYEIRSSLQKMTRQSYERKAEKRLSVFLITPLFRKGEVV